MSQPGGLGRERFVFKRVSYSDPEEYEVSAAGEVVGVARLNHGMFSVYSAAPDSRLLFSRNFQFEDDTVRTEPEEVLLFPESSDSWGEFRSGVVRDSYLNLAARKIAEHLGAVVRTFDLDPDGLTEPAPPPRRPVLDVYCGDSGDSF